MELAPRGARKRLTNGWQPGTVKPKHTTEERFSWSLISSAWHWFLPIPSAPLTSPHMGPAPVTVDDALQSDAAHEDTHTEE
jgi:hypothetical protein